ncbi:MAG TPA: hypothetical protein VM452_09165 [Caulifigura sp.]|jgi:hypothetical protein|nr:hypothetical protein [Caulifigura sp.]
MQHVQIAIPSWIIMFATVCAIAMFVRLANSNRIGLLVLIACGLGLMFFTVSARHSSRVTSITYNGNVEVTARVPQPPAPPVIATAESKPKPKRTPKPKPPAPAKAADTVAAAEPPMATAATTADPVVATDADPSPEAPLTLYEGSAKTGRVIESLPGWVNELAEARPGSTSVSFSSDRFASINEAEKQLWEKARHYVSGDLRMRVPEAVHWSPSPELLGRSGLIVERCVERTSIEVGQFVEPMYRVHWKANLSNDLRAAVADAWRPTVQAERLQGVTLGFLGATGAFAFLNIILRSIAARAARKSPAAA